MALGALVMWTVALSGATESDVLRFRLAPGPWALESQTYPNQHVEALGEQAGVWGSLAERFEGWAYPFKLFDGWSLLVREGDQPTPLASLSTRHIAAPHLSQLEYSGADWRLVQTWFVPRSLPGALLLLDYRGTRDLKTTLRFRPSLSPMHLKPAARFSLHGTNQGTN